MMPITRTATLGLLACAAAGSVVAIRSVGRSGSGKDVSLATRPDESSLAESLAPSSSSSPALQPAGAEDARSTIRPAPGPEPELEVAAPPRDLDELRADGAGEKAFYEAYRRLARESPDELTEGGRAVLLREDVSDPEKVALLRAVHGAELPGSVELFATAIVDLPDSSARGVESVPSFAVRFLGSEGVRDPRAREILERAIWPVAGAAAPAVRRRAAAYLGAAISESDLTRISALLRVEPDSGVVEAALASIATNPRTAHRELHEELGFPPPEPASDADDGD